MSDWRDEDPKDGASIALVIIIATSLAAGIVGAIVLSQNGG